MLKEWLSRYGNSLGLLALGGVVAGSIAFSLTEAFPTARPFAMVVVVPLFGVFLLVAALPPALEALYWGQIVLRRAPDPWTCKDCGYSLRGLPGRLGDMVCPECGVRQVHGRIFRPKSRLTQVCTCIACALVSAASAAVGIGIIVTAIAWLPKR